MPLFFEHEYATDYKSFLSRQPGIGNIQAMEDAEVLQLNYNNMQRLYNQIPAWQKYGRLVAEAIFLQAEDRAKELLLSTPEDMYLRLVHEQSQILDRVPQHLIASYLGIKPESLSRIRKRVMVEKRA
ncbi:MAG: Crp/Fnr family transcriptional regulator [Bacteroidia bacterium]|nr:Crp/Fnr family transcriptional regulator [Bacteroidia bacterium]